MLDLSIFEVTLTGRRRNKARVICYPKTLLKNGDQYL